MNEIAVSFLTRCFSSQETVALLLRRQSPPAAIQRIARLESVLAPRYRGWLAAQDRAGSNIYIAANPLRPGSRRRTKECIAEVRHLYLDIDTDGDARIASLLASDRVPAPHCIVSTSPGKYQVLWRVQGFDFAQQEQALKLLAIAFGGDPACTDCNRVLRVPGFLNHKYDPAHRVTVQYRDDSIWTPDDFRLDFGAADLLRFGQPIALNRRSGKRSNSESDWAWVSRELARGKDAGKLTSELASRRADKPNPLYYAQRTVDVASSRLWLIEGLPMDEVIARLESRRRFELPASICSARAREIAATAERMIAHKKTA